MTLSVPAAFLFGLLGIIFDKKKLLAVVTTIIAGFILAWYIAINVAILFYS